MDPTFFSFLRLKNVTFALPILPPVPSATLSKLFTARNLAFYPLLLLTSPPLLLLPAYAPSPGPFKAFLSKNGRMEDAGKWGVEKIFVLSALVNFRIPAKRERERERERERH